MQVNFLPALLEYNYSNIIIVMQVNFKPVGTKKNSYRINFHITATY